MYEDQCGPAYIELKPGGSGADMLAGYATGTGGGAARSLGSRSTSFTFLAMGGRPPASEGSPVGAEGSPVGAEGGSACSADAPAAAWTSALPLTDGSDAGGASWTGSVFFWRACVGFDPSGLAFGGLPRLRLVVFARGSTSIDATAPCCAGRVAGWVGARSTAPVDETSASYNGNRDLVLEPSRACIASAVVWGSKGASRAPPPSSMDGAVDVIGPEAVAEDGSAAVAGVASSGTVGAPRRLRDFFVAIPEAVSMSIFRLRGRGGDVLGSSTMVDELGAGELRFAEGPAAACLRLRAALGGAPSVTPSSSAAADAIPAGTNMQTARSSCKDARRAGTTVAALGIPRSACGT